MMFDLGNIGCAKDNMKSPIHNWYRFTAGFSYKFVDSLLKEIPKDSVVYEPFAGCGTTLVSSQKQGVYSVGNEGQEFMFDICRAKLNWTIKREAVENHIQHISEIVANTTDQYDLHDENPLLLELFETVHLKTLCIIRNYINSIEEEKYKLFFKLALSSVLHKTAIHPISVPYISRKKTQKNDGEPLEIFIETCQKMVKDIENQSIVRHQSKVYLHDSRNYNYEIGTDSCSLCITSPPYLNNLDYGEVSKVLSHFWGITNTWSDITTKVRVNLVTGSTTHYKDADFNIDTFKKTQFAINNENLIPQLMDLFERIKNNSFYRSGKKSFHILMMHYFNDMYNVLIEMRRVLKPGAKSYMILGDSAPYGVYIPTTQLLGEIAISAGFEGYAIYKIRTRGTKWKSLSNRHNIELSENILELN